MPHSACSESQPLEAKSVCVELLHLEIVEPEGWREGYDR
jgi:hypothetical protein